MNKTNNNKRFRAFMLIIYQDDLCYFEYMNFIEQYQFKNKNYRYLYITHDKDLDDNGNVKKNMFMLYYILIILEQ